VELVPVPQVLDLALEVEVVLLQAIMVETMQVVQVMMVWFALFGK
jgi:hypothetical protein